MPLDCLVEASFHGDSDVVRRLLQSCGPIIAMQLLNTPMSIGDDVFDEKCTALQIAILENHSDLAELLINHWPCDIDYQAGCTFFAPGEESNAVGAGFIENISALWCAAYRGNDKIVQLLLSNGANVNIQTKYGSTPLRVACLNGRASTVKILLAAGADICAATKDGSMAIQAACWSTLNSSDMVQSLLERAPEDYVNSADRNGETPAFIAAGRSLTTLKLLVKHGADLTVKDRNGKTCLMRAAENGKKHIVEYLLKSKTQELEARNRNDKTALQLATESGHADVAVLLLEETVKSSGNSGVQEVGGRPQSGRSGRSNSIANFQQQSDAIFMLLTQAKLNRLQDRPMRRARSDADEPAFIEKCVCCKKKSVDAVLLPCRHLCCCTRDAELLLQKQELCPVCNEIIDSVLEVRRR